jgi:peptide deformylase
VPYTELVNPVLTPLSEAIDEDWEGCLSVPGLRGMVPRYAHLRYEGFDPLGHPIRREVTGFHARVVQHEWRPPAGHSLSDAVRDLSRFGYTDIIFPDSAPDEE